MPRAGHHLVGGAITAGAVNAAVQWGTMAADPRYRFDWEQLLACCAAGAATALLPDILEPACHPNHRKFFHSLAAAAVVAWMMSGKHTDEYSAALKALVTAAGLGWLSHVFLDALTPKCVPII